MTRATPATPTGTPIRSSGPSAVSSRVSATRRRAKTATISPNGTLTRNIPRQLHALINTAPTEGPKAAPSAPAAPQIPIATPRRESGNCGRTIASEAGMRNAPPVACTTRATIRVIGLLAIPHRAEPARNRYNPAVNVALRPRRSAVRPASSNSDAKAML